MTGFSIPVGHDRGSENSEELQTSPSPSTSRTQPHFPVSINQPHSAPDFPISVNQPHSTPDLPVSINQPTQPQTFPSPSTSHIQTLTSRSKSDGRTPPAHSRHFSARQRLSPKKATSTKVSVHPLRRRLTFTKRNKAGIESDAISCSHHDHLFFLPINSLPTNDDYSRRYVIPPLPTNDDYSRHKYKTALRSADGTQGRFPK